MPRKISSSLFIAFTLNLAFAFFELFAGFISGSVAITSDAIHDFGDSFSIAISFFLEKYSQKRANSKYSFGYARYSVLGSIITTIVLILGSSFVVLNAVLRLFNPTPIIYDQMIIFAIFGIIVNGLATALTLRANSLNQKAVNLHMLEDVLNWVVILVGAVIMRLTDLPILDPLLSISVAIFLVFKAIKNLRDELDLFLFKTPADINPSDIRHALLELPEVENVHHLHFWSIDGYENYATLHAVPKHSVSALATKTAIRCALKDFHITHVTIELEAPSS